jgi:hypothetical protein
MGGSYTALRLGFLAGVSLVVVSTQLLIYDNWDFLIGQTIEIVILFH